MRRLLAALLLLASTTLADVEFTYPAAGDSIPAGAVTVKWKDSGSQPSIGELQSYTLQLMVGGNDPSIALPLVAIQAGGMFSEGNEATGTVSPSLAQTLDNGFYLQMISTSKDGGTVTNYSPRFTITGLTGTTATKYVEQVEALGGSLSGPATVNDVVPKAVAPAAPAAPVAPAAPAAPVAPAGFDIPYNQQEGLTRYAPMQPVPPTKITAVRATPLYPTSAFTIARTKMPPPTVLTTLTQSQTFSVQSIENTMAAQPNPKNDMQKFLARWKD